MLQILINIFWQIKIKTKRFGISYHNNIFFHYYIFFYFYNDLIKLFWMFLVILLCWYKRYSICLISFFNLYELFSAFISTNSIASLVNDLFRVNIFYPFSSFTYSSPSSGGISHKSVDSSLTADFSLLVVSSSFSDDTL